MPADSGFVNGLTGGCESPTGAVMSKSANKLSNAPGQDQLICEHVDRRGRVSLLPLSKGIQRLFAVSNLGSLPGAEPPIRPVADDGRAAPRSLTAREWQVLDLV